MNQGENAMAQHEHKQVPIMEDGEEIFQVDKKLQSLIQFLCDQEIYTYNSCQDNVGDTVWIQYDLESWMYITNVAYNSDNYELFQFIEEICQVLLLSSDDGNMDENDEYWIPGKNLIWSASVRFPKELLSEFEQLIRDLLNGITPPEK
jgi:hypothetical protein